ncbi:hypothetical protein ACQEU5_01150 [Marinactinospora thermotolerans]|uniref:Uncharacterized protein n=1 Tax=Marinactinospora thermotolerans DSM 45154 TaxID=1122192 RepID=A0A1T4MG00_9ACTN|nr:hypothetical protein [Marinactinospora thermotolerans]SJZ65694.1 hypothetical protein SAMN02745673_01097 [Marinactinospora thermotolerans DSM 45154]
MSEPPLLDGVATKTRRSVVAGPATRQALTEQGGAQPLAPAPRRVVDIAAHMRHQLLLGAACVLPCLLLAMGAPLLCGAVPRLFGSQFGWAVFVMFLPQLALFSVGCYVRMVERGEQRCRCATRRDLP